MSAKPARDPIASAWLVLSSERTTAVLVILLAVLAALTAFIPQGRDALLLAIDPDASRIHRLAALGLTDVFASPWARALFALLVANFLASLVRVLGTERARSLVRPPAGAPYRADLRAALPERAVEALYATFKAILGNPAKEEVEGSRVTMVFEASPGGRAAPLLVHLGLLVLIAGAAWAATPPPENHLVVRAKLEVKDMSTGATGTFDMVSGEHFQFFRWPAEYSLVDYLPDKDGLGPALRIQKVNEKERRSDDFWVYQNAPEGFDEHHRKGEVAIKALKMGSVPLPGESFGASTAAVLVLLGFSLFAFGLVNRRGAEGLVWLEADGDRVSVIGVPRMLDDKSFEERFSRFARVAAWAIREPAV